MTSDGICLEVRIKPDSTRYTQSGSYESQIFFQTDRGQRQTSVSFIISFFRYFAQWIGIGIVSSILPVSYKNRKRIGWNGREQIKHCTCIFRSPRNRLVFNRTTNGNCGRQTFRQVQIHISTEVIAYKVGIVRIVGMSLCLNVQPLTLHCIEQYEVTNYIVPSTGIEIIIHHRSIVSQDSVIPIHIRIKQRITSGAISL